MKVVVRIIGVIVILTGSLITGAFGQHAMAQDFTLRSHSSSMEPVDIMLDGKVHLRIPKAYLVKVQNWIGGDQDSVYVEAVLPDLRPVKPGEILKIDQGLVVSIWLNDPIGSVGLRNKSKKIDQLKSYCENENFKICKLSDDYFDAYKSGKAPSMGFARYNNYYITARDRRYIIIQCEKRNIGLCSNTTNFGLGMTSQYFFDRAFIPQKWKEIDDKVSRLIEQFIVNENGDMRNYSR